MSRKHAFFLFLVVLSWSILIQLPQFRSYYRPHKTILDILYVITLASSAKHFSLNSTFTKKLILFLTVLCIYVCTIVLLKGGIPHSMGSMFFPAIIAISIFYISNSILNNNTTLYITIITIYTILTTALVVEIFIDYLHPLNLSFTYAYKNQQGPIILFSALLILYLINSSRNKLLKYILWVTFLFEFTCLNFLKNRSSLLALYITLAAILLKFYKKHKKAFYQALLLVIPAILTLILTEPRLISKIFLWALLPFIFGHNPYNINNLSSGRLALYKKAISVFLQHPIFGVLGQSSYYVDNSFLNWATGYGIIGLLLYTWLWFEIAKLSIKHIIHSDSRNLKLYVALMWLGALTISLFEASAPFSPGTTYFIIWTLLPVLSSNLHNMDPKGSEKSEPKIPSKQKINNTQKFML